MIPVATVDPSLEPALRLGIGDVASFMASAFLFSLLWWPFVAGIAAGAWVAFEKAGRPGWTSLVPVYNGLQFIRIAKSPPWWLALLLVPGVNVGVFAVLCARIARAFGQGRRFAVGLTLMTPVFLAVLGLGRARYRRFDVVSGTARAAEPLRERAMPALTVGVPRLVPVR